MSGTRARGEHPADGRPTTVVLGAGYAGVMAANRLAGGDRRVIVVNPVDVFVERIRLHELVAGSRASAVRPLPTLLAPGVELRVGEAARIDADARLVRLHGGARLGYDELVYAVGSGSSPDRAAGEHAVSSLEDAVRLRAALDVAPPRTRVVVLGAGLTGVETAAEIAEARSGLDVELRTRGALAPGTGPGARRAMRASLARLGVRVVEHARETRDLVGPGVVVVHATGFAVPGLAVESGLPVDASGRLVVGPDLRVEGRPGILGAGDAVVVGGVRNAALRMSCAAALPQGATAADVLLGRAARLDAGFVAQCASLGRASASVQLVRADDSPRAAHLTGRPAAAVKELICRQTLRWLRDEGRRPGSYSWVRGPRIGSADGGLPGAAASLGGPAAEVALGGRGGR